MTNYCFQAIVFALMLSTPALAYGPATERFIPIGQSPGISGVHSVQGTIVAVTASTLTIQTGAGLVLLEFTERTAIWIDRSRLKLTNLAGTAADLTVGRRVEAYVPRWIKVEGER